jgi:hypothetical protein
VINCHLVALLIFVQEIVSSVFLFLLALTFLLGLIQGSQISAALNVHSLIGKLAPPAESVDLHRTTQQCKLSQAACTF